MSQRQKQHEIMPTLMAIYNSIQYEEQKTFQRTLWSEIYFYHKNFFVIMILLQNEVYFRENEVCAEFTPAIFDTVPLI